MRSRYSAFAVGDVDYLLRTWHPATRPRTLELDPDQRWTRLDIVRTLRGGLLDTDGVVEFTAYFRSDTEAGRQHETSRFVRLDRQWYYSESL